MTRKETLFQLVWGIVLTSAGVMMFINIPQKLEEIRQYFSSSIGFLRFCLYTISILLVFGGVKKISDHFFGGKRNK